MTEATALRPAEAYGTEVPERLAERLHRWKVTPAELAALISAVGHHWPAIEAHVKAHLLERRYQACTTLPGHLCNRWCPVGGDPYLVAAMRPVDERPISDIDLPAGGGADD